ncbi:nuclear transcription factor Y subunit C-4-like [Actinidia eriantha]|uniref:nuclear transcription factor Y subunit C-4-like n=1 Tax=Actinidia eriantha TaxID=165200 RepID=UPI00258B9F37|nr:nuclear transcription factor Y subunit C-4-like [Actinidia eriantha]
MDLKQTTEFSASSTPQGQVHNFMPMPAFGLAHNHQPSHEDGEEPRYSHFMQLQKQMIDIFWSQRMIEIHNIQEFKSQQQLPLARIKKIMKSDEQVKMISADTPILFSKACEFFVLELAVRAWLHTQENRRRTLQRCDIARAIRSDELLDFLVDVVQLENHQ